MDEALTWKGTVTIRGRAREVELKFYPERGCWQLFEWRGGEKPVRIGVRGLVTEVLSIAAADLLCQATGRAGARPHPFEESFSTRYQILLKKSAHWLKRTDGDLLTAAERKRYHRVLDELQGYEAREDQWRGKGPLLSTMADHQHRLLRAMENLMDITVREYGTKAEKGKAK